MPMRHTKFFQASLNEGSEGVGIEYRHASGLNTSSKDLTSLAWAEVIQAL
jgi:hypothetical protein